MHLIACNRELVALTVARSKSVQACHARKDLGCAAGLQETRDVRKPVLRCPHHRRLAVGVLR